MFTYREWENSPHAAQCVCDSGEHKPYILGGEVGVWWVCGIPLWKKYICAQCNFQCQCHLNDVVRSTNCSLSLFSSCDRGNSQKVLSYANACELHSTLKHLYIIRSTLPQYPESASLVSVCSPVNTQHHKPHRHNNSTMPPPGKRLVSGPTIVWNINIYIAYAVLGECVAHALACMWINGLEVSEVARVRIHVVVVVVVVVTWWQTCKVYQLLSVCEQQQQQYTVFDFHSECTGEPYSTICRHIHNTIYTCMYYKCVRSIFVAGFSRIGRSTDDERTQNEAFLL